MIRFPNQSWCVWINHKLPRVLLQFGFLLIFMPFKLSAKPIVNVYVWGGEIPKHIIQQFELRTGIGVNFSTYDSNETMYAKIKASPQGIYDVILPSSYYVERMRSQNMLAALDPQQVPNIKYIESRFQNNPYDPKNQFSIPLIWGATGIFYHKQKMKNTLSSWNQLWNPQFKNALLLLDDAREVFAMALISLGYSPNDTNLDHITEAYHKLLALVPNIKLFSSEGIQALLIDEDVMTGMVWNGDAYKAYGENSAIEFVYPKEGFVIWVDCLAIPKNAPHPQQAYAFINFLLQPEVAQQIGLIQGHAITNTAGKALLPIAIQNNPMVYPPETTLTHGHIQRDPGEQVVVQFNEYWQQLKMSF